MRSRFVYWDRQPGWSAAMSRPNRHGSGPDILDQITVVLVSKAATDLARTRERTRMSKTDIVNRAISLYDFLDSERESGAELLIRRRDGQNYLVELAVTSEQHEGAITHIRRQSQLTSTVLRLA